MELLQDDNYSVCLCSVRLLNQEEQWLNDVEATIAMKDARIRTVQKEKEEQIQRVRIGWMDGRTKERTNERMDGWTYQGMF